MAEADADHRLAADQFADRRGDRLHRSRVSGTVGQEEQVGIAAHHFAGRGLAGQQCDPAVAFQELVDDRGLDSGVERHDVRSLSVVFDRGFRGDLGSEVGSGHRWLGFDRGSRLVDTCRCRKDPAPHRAPVADVTDQGPGVDPGDRPDSVCLEPVEPATFGGRGIGMVPGFAHDHAAGMGPARLHRPVRNPVVADHRIGEGDDLAGVGGIGDRFLVAGHRRVEDHFADPAFQGTAEQSVKPAAVFEQDVSGLCLAHATPRLKVRRRKAT